MCVCLCLSVLDDISHITRPNFTKFYMRAIPVAWLGFPMAALRYDMHFRFLSMSSCFYMMGPWWRNSIPQQPRCSVVRGLTPLLFDGIFVASCPRRRPGLKPDESFGHAKEARGEVCNAQLLCLPLTLSAITSKPTISTPACLPTHLAPCSCASDSVLADQCARLQIIFIYLLAIDIL